MRAFALDYVAHQKSVLDAVRQFQGRINGPDNIVASVAAIPDLYLLRRIDKLLEHIARLTILVRDVIAMMTAYQTEVERLMAAGSHSTRSS